MQKTISTVVVASALALALYASSNAADFTWSASEAGLWSDGSNWAGGNAPSGENIALLNPTARGQLNLNANASIGSFTASFTTDTWDIRGFDAARTLTIGSLAKGGSGIVTFGNGSGAALSLEIGSITLTGGRLGLGVQNTQTQLTSVAVSGKTELFGTSILFANATSAIFGEVSLSNTAAFEIFAFAYSGPSPRSGGITVAGLSGTGGTVRVIYAANRDLRGTLTLNPDAGESYSYGGTVVDRGGTGGTTTLALVKNGAGIQKFSGNNTYSGSTTINAGTLLVNGTHINGGAIAGAGTYTVNDGGTLGGTGTINTAGANVIINVGGKLAAGDSGVGTLTFTLGTGTLDIKNAIAAVSSQALHFDLSSIEASDKIVLTSGTLDIGSGKLGLDSFSFNFLNEFGPGEYTLFDTSQTIVGTLGSNLSGVLGGHEVTLALASNNQNIVLIVGAPIPEPAATVILIGIGGLVFAGFACRRRRHDGNSLS
ncbi:autotransporter-associated beta strand repeat-containing protein [Geminisphaera colitermitum]|uniref:autotransporter-associated beta strand repeat-containing protein n=1 Tax=Geminisphaera colitermitum TaxID=1148786 RepID=UPI000158D600|nr:autotransporter-associated beta strand repeat-containing protein [Geminisphaera colitermitum]